MKIITNTSKLKLLEILNRIELFDALEASQRNLLADIPDLIVFIEAKSTFIKAGELDTTFYILLNGTATILDNKSHITDVNAGDFIGEVGFICNEKRSATVTAKTDILSMRISQEIFISLPMAIRERIKDKIIKGLTKRIKSQNQLLISLFS